MEVRPAKPGDLQTVLEIVREGFHQPGERFGAAWLVKACSSPGTRLLVEDAGAGLVRGFLLSEEYETGTLVRFVAVDSGYRRQGVGRRLLETVKSSAAAWVRSENVASRGLFTSCGWVERIPPQRRKGDWVYFVRKSI